MNFFCFCLEFFVWVFVFLGFDLGPRWYMWSYLGVFMVRVVSIGIVVSEYEFGNL